jgi:hypothetical protein
VFAPRIKCPNALKGEYGAFTNGQEKHDVIWIYPGLSSWWNILKALKFRRIIKSMTTTCHLQMVLK